MACLALTSYSYSVRVSVTTVRVCTFIEASYTFIVLRLFGFIPHGLKLGDQLLARSEASYTSLAVVKQLRNHASELFNYLS